MSEGVKLDKTEGGSQAEAAAEKDRRRWGDTLKLYLHPRVIAMLFLGFSAGLPLLLVFSTLSLWLREAGISRTEIGFFAWIGILYSFKVFWAPVIDNLPLPGLDRLLGRRRSWMLLGQGLIVAGLVGMAMTDPAVSPTAIALFGVLVAFGSSTQDIVIDAYRIEAVGKTWQGAMASNYVLGYRLAMLTAGAGALYIAADTSWSTAYLIMAACMAVGVVTVMLIKEPVLDLSGREAVEKEMYAFIDTRSSTGTRLSNYWELIGRKISIAVIGPFVDFFMRNAWYVSLLILAFVAMYRISDLVMGIMANPFYHDLGFTKTEIADISKVYGLIMLLLGSYVGGFLVAQIGIMRPLLLGAVMVAATNLAFAWLATVGNDIYGLMVTISLDNLAGGLATAAFIAYLSSLVNHSYSATQYALFSSLMTLPGKLISGTSGLVVDGVGYFWFFIYASAMGLPAILLVLILMRWGPQHQAPSRTPAEEQPAQA